MLTPVNSTQLFPSLPCQGMIPFHQKEPLFSRIATTITNVFHSIDRQLRFPGAEAKSFTETFQNVGTDGAKAFSTLVERVESDPNYLAKFEMYSSAAKLCVSAVGGFVVGGPVGAGISVASTSAWQGASNFFSQVTAGSKIQGPLIWLAKKTRDGLKEGLQTMFPKLSEEEASRVSDGACAVGYMFTKLGKGYGKIASNSIFKAMLHEKENENNFSKLVTEATKHLESETEKVIEQTTKKVSRNMKEHFQKTATVPLSQPEPAFSDDTREFLGHTSQIFDSLSDMVDNPKTAEFLSRTSRALPNFVQTCDAMSLIGSGAASGSALGHYGALIGGLVGLASALFGSSNNGFSEMLIGVYEALHKDIVELYQFNVEFRQEVVAYLESIRKDIGELEYLFRLNFMKTHDLLKDTMALNAYYSTNLLEHLSNYFDILNYKADAIYLQNRFTRCSDIDRFQERYGKPLNAITREESRPICQVLEDGLRAKPENPHTIPNSIFNGYHCRDVSPKAIIKNFGGALETGDWLGYLFEALKHLGIPLPASIHPESLPNVKLYLHEAAHYLTLRRAMSAELHYDDTDSLSGEVCQGAFDVRHAIEYLLKNRMVVTNALTQYYNSALEKFISLYNEGFDIVSKETLEEALHTIPQEYRPPNAEALAVNLQTSYERMLEATKDRTFLNNEVCVCDFDYGYKMSQDCPSNLHTPLSSFPFFPQLNQKISQEIFLAERLHVVRFLPKCQVRYSSYRGLEYGDPHITLFSYTPDPSQERFNFGMFDLKTGSFNTLQGFLNSIPSLPNTPNMDLEAEWIRPHQKGLEKAILRQISNLRQKIASRFFEKGTSLGVRWEEASEHLTAARILVQRVLPLLGLPQYFVDYVLNATSTAAEISIPLQKWVHGDFSDMAVIPPSPSNFISEEVSRYFQENKKEVKVEEIPLVAPLCALLDQFATFHQMHINEVEKQKKKEAKAAAGKQMEEETQSQKLQKLEEAVTDLSRQNALLIEKIEALLNQRKHEL